MCHHTMCATTVERMGMEIADTGNNDDEQQWIATMLERLSHSQFRAKFALTDKDRAYARTKGKATIDRHAREMLRDRIGAAEPKNDGRQTPWRGHPVFDLPIWSWRGLNGTLSIIRFGEAPRILSMPVCLQ